MKFRRRPSPLLLFLLPAIASAVAVQDTPDATLPSKLLPRDTKAEPETTPLIDLTSKSKYEIGTKAAPVDGKDGMPHAGPWVGKEDVKKGTSKPKDDELVVGKEDLTKKIKTADGGKIPDSNDGVMDDKHRPAPKEGTRGTEGGVSEKDKARKAKEGQTGEKAEQTPGSPKAPVSPDDATVVKDEVKPKLKDVEAQDEDAAGSLAGLEVCMLDLRLGNTTSDFICRNRKIFQPNPTAIPILFQPPRTKITLIFPPTRRQASLSHPSKRTKA